MKQQNSISQAPIQSVPFTYMLLAITFSVCLIVSNLVEIKTISLGWLTITGGVLVFPISYIINDCVAEVYGFKLARTMIFIGFAASLGVTLVLQATLALPGSAEWTSQEAMEAIYGSVPRIMAASYAAFLAGSLVNAYTMHRMKARAEAMQPYSENRLQRLSNSFSARAILSTIFGEGLDSLIFFPIAFAGTLSWTMIVSLILTQTLIKTVYEIMILPVTARIAGKLSSRISSHAVHSS
ncbi:MAG: queuosine precursor transporter [Muribaculaceae bacterium]|nr:queuosine precursor transporter [Muribaculaceae bacterium]